MKKKIEIEELTLNEIDLIESTLDMPVERIADPGAKKGAVLRAMVWVMGRRENPDLTLEEAGNMKLSDLDIDGDQDEDPKAARGK